MTVLLAGAMVALLIAIGLGVDGSRAVAASLRVGGEARLAARTGADALVVQNSYASSTPALDPSAADRAVTSYIAATGDQLASAPVITAASVSVTVQTRVPTSILGLIGISSITVSQTATARAEEGP
jgi:hypothetical protein